MFAPHYFAKSGETAVMSELLLRGYNVAVPTLDDGDDIYVTDEKANLTRIQVKSAACQKTPAGFSGQVRLKHAQLKNPKATPLVYIFCLRWRSKWKYIIAPRESFEQKFELHGAGTIVSDWVFCRITFDTAEKKVRCLDCDFKEFLGWDKVFPIIKENPKPKRKWKKKSNEDTPSAKEIKIPKKDGGFLRVLLY